MSVGVFTCAPTSREQYAQLTELRESEPRFAGVYRECVRHEGSFIQ
jgi:hypothetical protein